MGCLIDRDKNGKIRKVLAPGTGRPSLLYEQIRQNIPDDYQPDRFVQIAFKEGMIRSLTSKDEVALALWSKVHTPFEKRPGMENETPPVKEGHVRLYRGETDAVEDALLSPWLREHPEYVNRPAANQFTASIGEARYHNEVFGTGDGRIRYIDVPEKEAEKYLSPGTESPDKGINETLEESEDNLQQGFLLPKELVAQSKPYTDSPELRDPNGEPILPALRQWLGLGSNLNMRKKISMESLVRFLLKEKLIYRDGDRHLLSKEPTLQYAGKNAEEQNAKRIQYMLEEFGLTKGAVTLRKGADGTIVSFDANQMKLDTSLNQATQQTQGDRTNTKRLVRFLKERFPQLSIEFTTVDKARAIYRQLQMMQPPNRRYKIDFDRVKSFVYKGKVYLIEGRVDDHEVIVEEALHPFVYTVSKDNPGLFKQLVEAAQKDFGDVHKQITELYTDKAGFTQNDRDQELVAQVLSKLFHKEYTTKPPASIRSLLNQFLEWFAKLVNDFGAFIGGKNQVVINTSQLKEGMNLTDIARMLNTFDSQFLVDTTSPTINFRQVPGWNEFMKKIMEKANELQKEVIKDVYHPKKPVRLIEKDHIYVDPNGQIYRSVTTAINGKFDDPEGKYELNRLFGNALDLILDSLVRDMKYEDVKEELEKKNLEVLDEDTAEAAYRELRSFLQGLRADGSIILPQVAVSDGNEIAGTIDLLQVHPNGTMTVIDLKTSKNSALDPDYTDKKIAAGEGSLLEGEPLSKAQRHGIQIGCYKRMLEVAGHTVVATKTYHIWLDIEGKHQSQKVKKFQMEDFVLHEPSENEVYVRQIIKAEPTEDRLAELRKKAGLDNPVSEGPDERTKQTKAYLDLFDQLRVKVEGFRDKLAKRVDRMDRIKSIASFKPAKEARQKLSELLMFISDDLSKGRANQAYGRFLRHAQEELNQLIEFLDDPSKKGTEEYIERVLDVDNYLETYRGMANASKWALGDANQERMLKNVQNLLDDTKTKVKESLEDYILRMVKTVSSKKDLTDEDWKDIIKQAVDISKADKYLGDIDTSTDALVAVAAKMYKFAKLRAMSRSEKFKTRLEEVGERLAKAFGGKPDYDMILDYDENGVFTGRYVQKIGTQFWRLYKAAKSKVTDDEGRMLKYRPVYSLINAKQEDLEYNKKLYQLKKEWYKFIEAEDKENLDEKGRPKKGKFFQYTKEFTDERDKYEEFKDGKWVKRSSVTWKEYKLYELKYYDTIEGYDTPFLHGGTEFRGVISQNTGSKMRIVKDAYREVREIAGDGTDMRSQKYLKLMTGTDERTKAMREFYEFFVESMGEALDLLPASIRRDMLGKIGRVRGKFIDQAKRSPAFFKAAAKSVTDWFTVRTSTRQAMYNEDGTLANQIPVFFTGNLRSEKLIESLEKKIKKLDEDLAAKKLSKADYLDKHKTLKDQLTRAQNALAHNEVETDLVKNLEKFYDMAASFDEMQRIEASLLAVQQKLEDRKYTRKTASGKELTDKEGNIVRFDGEDSRTLERYKAWMQMIFYSSQELDRSTWEVVAKRLMNISSITNVGFNAFGPIHNYAAARINTAIETWGGLFYDRSAGRRAVRAFRNEFLTGYVRNFNATEGFYYKKKRMGSKYEALVEKYHMIRHTRLGEGKPKKSALDSITYGYKGQSMGEFAVQSMSGMAYLMSQMVTSEDGKTTLSLYDAYEFDEKEQKLKFKQGFEYLEKDENKKFGITNTIWEINKQIHGNYAWEDQAMIQREILGQMAMQFHKWVYPAYKARFGAYYYDENLGHLEGRYRTILNLILLYKKAEGTFTERAKAAFKGLRPDQIKNMYRNAAELAYFALCLASYGLFKSIADGFGDDDKYQKRLINFLAWEASRERKEMQFWYPVAGASEQFEMIKNPFASGTTVTQFSDVLWELAKLPVPPYDDAYYTRGPFKGELKLKKEFYDLVPVMKELNRWATFDNVTSFHIK